MFSAPLFWVPRARCVNLRQPAARCALALELGEELAIGGDQRAGAAHDEGDLVIAIALIDQERNTCECSNIVLDGTESMVQAAGDFVGLQPLEVEADGLDTVGLAGADVLLLATARDLDTSLPQGIDIAHDGTDPAIEEAEGEVLVTEQAVLVAGLGGHAQDAGTAQAINAVFDADLEVLLRIIEREPDRDLLALVQGLTRRLGGVDDQQLDLAEPELVVGLVRVESKYLLDDRQDGLGDEWGAVGSLFDATTKHAVEGLGVEPALTQLRFEELGSQHECHLRSETPACTLG
jgi:hypothetical protein